jgi:hypothetical protein
LRFSHRENTLWLEFGVAQTASTTNYISQFTTDTVYGFDSFLGLPENWIEGYPEGTFSTNGVIPPVNPNVVIIPGLFQDTLPDFIKTQNKKISLIHFDCNLYSSTRFVLDTIAPYIDNECIFVFGNIVNFDGFSGNSGQLKALFEFFTETRMHMEWIGMNGTPYDDMPTINQNAAILFHCYL